MDKAIYVGFSILEMSKLHMYETYYDILQPNFGQEILQLHYIDTDGTILSMKTQNIIKDLKNLEDIFEFSNLGKNHEIYGNQKRSNWQNQDRNTKKNLDRRICLFKIESLFV